jgi:hypothetical protein
MSISLEAGKRLELRDESGQLLGYCLSVEAVRQLLAERDSLATQVADLQRSRAEQEKEPGELLAELEDYRKMLHYWETEGLAPPTKKDIAEMDAHGIPFEEIVAEIEAMVRVSPNEGHDDAQR